MYAYCNNNPVNYVDYSGESSESLKSIVRRWTLEGVKTLTNVTCRLVIDAIEYDADNTDVDKVYKSSYFSSYKGTLILRHSSGFLSSWAFDKTIWLNHNNDSRTAAEKQMILDHEYGHIKQEQELGTAKYLQIVFIPSATYNLMSRESQLLRSNYYNMPWEYDADIRGGVERKHSSFSGILSVIYWNIVR